MVSAEQKKVYHTLRAFSLVVSFLVIFGIGLWAGNFWLRREKPVTPETKIYKDKYLAFLFEVYEKIQENYWDKLTDERLVTFYFLGAEKLLNQPQPDQAKTRQSLESFFTKTLKELADDEKRKEFSAQISDLVLANLEPFGRSRLYSQKEETDLKNRVENRNPEIDQYQILDVEKDAPQEKIDQTYEQRSAQLQQEIKQETSPGKKEEKAQELAQLEQAHRVLADPDSRRLYNLSGVEPTMEYRLVKPDVYYLRLSKFSPTTNEELLRVTEKVQSKEGLNSLIIDLRDNVGGAIDGLPYFLGPFIGNDQYAYQFFHQGDRQDFKTKVGWLPSLFQYKRVVILVNENTQSSAEVMAAVLKKYNVGILVGSKTKGWGTVERVFPIENQIAENEKFSIFLVHSLTLKDDNQPIEGQGVEPVISTADPNWTKLLYEHYPVNSLVEAVEEVL